MKTRSNCEFRIANVAVVMLLAVLLGACSSTPTYPPPQAGSGQILVELHGEPKTGAPNAKSREVQDEYSRHRESVEKGKAFERVDYDELEDVVVVLDSATPILRDTPATSAAAILTIDDDGFDRSQIGSGPGLGSTNAGSSIKLRNNRDEALTIYGFSDNDSFEISIPANGEATATVAEGGTFDVYCDEDEALHCIWYAVTKGEVWVGPSDEAAFFNDLPPGSYEVHVYPPRLPEWSKTVKVTAGKRETVKAELTVNDLPKAK